MKKIVVSMIAMAFTLFLTLSVGVTFSSAQGSMLDKGKALMDKGKAMNQGAPAVTAPTVGTDAAAGQAATAEGQGTLTDKGKALMDKEGLMDKGKGLMNQGK